MTGEKLTDAELTKLAELEAVATPGPWLAESGGYSGNNWLVGSVYCGTGHDDQAHWVHLTTDNVHASEMRGDAETDAAYIAAACNALPHLLAELAAERVALKAERAWRTTAGRLLVKVETMLLNQGFDARAEEIEALLGEQPPDSLPGVTHP